jgi:hypothetical protein
MSQPLENLRVAFGILKRNVIRTLRTQRGAEMQLNHQIDEVLQFSAATQIVSRFFFFNGATASKSYSIAISFLRRSSERRSKALPT